MIAIIDYGMGNLRSVQKALERAGADARIVQNAAEMARADKIVLPGVGAFRDAIDRLRSHCLCEPLTKAIGQGVPFWGICLGMQLLFDVSYEDGRHAGLGILPGKVVRFDFESVDAQPRPRIPQMGWNQLTFERPCPMLTGIEEGSYVYFAHSYHVVCEDSSAVAATTDYGYSFASAIERDNLFATQFHPEKSQAVGARMLRNFVKL